MEQVLEIIMRENWEGGIFIIVNLILIESLLSIDNAAVLATMVMDLPPEDRPRALRWGIIGAYFFRGLSLIFAAWLIKIWWLKPLGGLYLLYLGYRYFAGRETPAVADDLLNKGERWYFKLTRGLLNKFWATVVAVEMMDLAFSIDNVFAAVAFTDNLYLICMGVFIGILAMRFVANWFVILLERFPFLEVSAFLVILLLGLKLAVSGLSHFNPETDWARWMESELADFLVSVLTFSFFVVPIVTSRLFSWPGSR